MVEGHNTGVELLISEQFSKVRNNDISDDPRHSLIEAGVVSEKWANPFREADNPLTIGHPWQDFVQEELDQFLLSIGMTAVAKAPAPTTQGDKEVLATPIAMKASQTELGQTALQ